MAKERQYELTDLLIATLWTQLRREINRLDVMGFDQLNAPNITKYTKAMLETFKRNVISCLILCTSRKKYDFDISVTDHMLYALAPLPYAPGIMPLLVQEEIEQKGKDQLQGKFD